MQSSGRTLFYNDAVGSKVVNAVLPLGLNAMDVTNEYHAVEGIYHPESRGVPSVVPPSVKRGAQFLPEFYNFMRIGLVFRLDKRGILCELFVRTRGIE